MSRFRYRHCFVCDQVLDMTFSQFEAHVRECGATGIEKAPIEKCPTCMAELRRVHKAEERYTVFECTDEACHYAVAVRAT